MSEHVVSPRIYLAVFAALLVLTFVTTEASRFDLGQPDVLGFHVPLNVIVALAIAALKASLVVLFFMHVKYGERLVQLVIAAAIVWLFILILITISDYGSRPWPIAHT
jgi:cytochrome c oxidase subunit 4